MFTEEKRHINFRPLLWIFMFAVCSIYATASIFLEKLWIFISFCVIFSAVLVIFIVSLFCENILKSVKTFFGIKNLKIFCMMILTTCLLFGSFAAINITINKKRDFSNAFCSINAVVGEVTQKSGSQSVLLCDVFVDGKKQSFYIKATFDDENQVLTVGDRVDFEATLFENKLIKNGEYSTNSIKTKVNYFCSIPEGVFVSKGDAGLVNQIKERLKDLYIKSFDSEIAGFSYAVVMGDKSMISDEVYQNFQSAGLAHILAISGLHVGFLVAILLFVLKLLKIKQKVRFFVIFLILLLYNILCGFAPSVFRASIMSLCLLFGMIIGERNDSLSNLSFAGIIILLLQPLYVFDVGFLLSFSAVFGILLFQRPISNLFQKAYINKFVAEPIALTLSATIGTFGFVSKYFQYISISSLLSNLIVLPVFVIYYYVLIPFTILGLIFGPSVLFLSNFVGKIVLTLSGVFAKFGTFSILSFDDLCVAIYLLILFFSSPFFMISPKRKFVVTFALTFAFMPVLMTTNSENFYNYDSFSVCESANQSVLLTTAENQKILLNVGGAFYETNSIKKMLKKNKILNVDVLVLTNYSNQIEKNLVEVLNNFRVKKIINISVQNQKISENLQKIYKNIKFFDENSQNFDINENISVKTFVENESIKAINFSFYEKNFLAITKSVSKSNLQNEMFQSTFDAITISSIYDNRYSSLKCANIYCHSYTYFDENITLIDDLWTIKF